MKTKLVIIALMNALFIQAQDIIVTNNAQRQLAKIMEVSDSEIKYKDWDNLDGPLFILPTNEINSVIFSNGKVILYNNISGQQRFADEADTLQSLQSDVKVGDLMTFSDGSRGIVFYVDNEGHGLVVSMLATSAAWENAEKRKLCQDIPSLPNLQGAKSFVYGLGKTYTSYILEALGADRAPAAAWCVQQGEGWYLPSDGELWYLMAAANEGKEELGPVSMALIKSGGLSLSSDEWYWSSTENEKDEAVNVSCGGRLSSDYKNKLLLVRAVREF